MRMRFADCLVLNFNFYSFLTGCFPNLYANLKLLYASGFVM